MGEELHWCPTAYLISNRLYTKINSTHLQMNLLLRLHIIISRISTATSTSSQLKFINPNVFNFKRTHSHHQPSDAKPNQTRTTSTINYNIMIKLISFLPCLIIIDNYRLIKHVTAANEVIEVSELKESSATVNVIVKCEWDFLLDAGLPCRLRNSHRSSLSSPSLYLTMKSLFVYSPEKRRSSTLTTTHNTTSFKYNLFN